MISAVIMMNIFLTLSILFIVTRGNEEEPHQETKVKGYRGLHVIVVYHAYLNEGYKQWPALLSNQLLSVKESGLFDIVNELYVTLTTGAQKNEMLWEKGSFIVKNITNLAIINASFGDYYEYDGVYKAWNASIAAKHKENTIVSYFHSKGAFNHGGGEYRDGRSRANIFLTKVVMEDWRFILDQFIENKVLKTAGLAACCHNRAQFHNFWWARASYISGIHEPKYGANIERHYYEFWLGENSVERKTNDTMSLCDARYHILEQPLPPNCDAHVKDGAHNDDNPANNMKYAIYCEAKITPLLGIRKSR